MKLATLLTTFALAGYASAAVSFNEIRIDQPSSDDDEFVEFFTTSPSESLDGLTHIIIGDGTGGSGVIEHVLDLSGNSSSLNFFLVAEATFDSNLGTPNLTATLNFENGDNTTHLLVQDFTGANGDDLDTDDDGTLDATPWTAIIDEISLVRTVGSGDEIYSSTTLGPNGTFAPAHVYREIDGSGAWAIGDFEPIGATDTPGVTNIPEPSTAFLALLGSTLFFFRRGRR